MDRNLPPASGSVNQRSPRATLALSAGILMLLGWTIGMAMTERAPGWMHLFLTLGVFLLILGIVLGDAGGNE